MHATQYVLRTCAAFKWSNTLLLNLKMTAGEFMPRAGLQILLESMSLVQCRKSNICLKRPGRILGRRKTPIPRVMVAKPPLQIRGRSDITLLRIVYRSKNVCVEHSVVIPQQSLIRPPTRFLGNGYGGHPSFATAVTPPLRGWRAIRSRFASQIAKDGRGERI